MEFYNAHISAKRQHDYEQELQKIMESLDPLILAICRKWHGNEDFGKPGHGSVEYVIDQIYKADLARQAIVEYNEA